MKRTRHPNRRQRALSLALSLTFVLTGAGSAAAETVSLRLEHDGLEPLGRGFVYEGWLVANGIPVSTGTFSVAADGSASRTDFVATVADGAALEAFVLTVEPSPDPDPAPSPVHVIAGDFASGLATLTAAHPAALGSTFGDAAGTFVLAAPSAGAGGDYRNGIWWLDPGAGPGPGLDLPELPEGWAYEGWVAGPMGAVSTGRFTNVAQVDSDAGGLGAGPFGTPAFPGQDFVNPPVDLTTGYAAVISVEPEPDDSAAPFAFKPLVGTIADAGEGAPQEMTNQSAGFPTATVRVLEPGHRMRTVHLALDLAGLEDLGDGAAYEGWLVADGMPVSTGTFTVSGGVPSERMLAAEVSATAALSAFVLTIEPVPDLDPTPSAVHLLAGDFAAGSARLSIAHPAALGTDFAEAAGGYILAAPSAGAGGDYRNGIWWLDPAAGPGPALVLPDLPEGWVYEGWVAGSDGPVSTGRFTSVSGADSDGGGPAAGPEETPGFPGQDFVDPPVDLTTGYAAVISVEPEPDTSPEPFVLKPLLDLRIDDVGTGVLQPMARNLTDLPRGVVTLATQRLIAAAAHVPGVAGTNWRTDLELHNPSGEAASARVELLRSGQSNPSPANADLSVPARSSVRVTDAVEALFGVEASGALRVLSPSGELLVASRTYTLAAPGTYGQAIPAATADRAVAFGAEARLTQLAAAADLSSGFRTNLVLLNPDSTPVEVTVDLHDADGELLGTLEVSLLAGEQCQLNDVFARVTDRAVEVGYAVVRTSTPGGRVLAFASVVDNLTGDAVWVQP